MHLVTWAIAALGGVINYLSSGFTAVCCNEGERTHRAVLAPSQEELEHTLGESAAQGAAGVVLWVSWENTRTKVSSGLRTGWWVSGSH